jgi:uncharacterized protein
VDGFGGKFEWEAAKAEANVAKHKISFESAAKVFDDPNIVLMKDRIDETGEQRWNAIGNVEVSRCCSLRTCIEEETMTKRSSESSQPGEQIRVSADSIFKRPLSGEQKTVLRELAAKQAAGDDSGIDYSDIPPLTDDQMATGVRGWRYFRRPVLLEQGVVETLTEIAARKGMDLDTLVNDILKREIAMAEVLR